MASSRAAAPRSLARCSGQPAAVAHKVPAGQLVLLPPGLDPAGVMRKYAATARSWRAHPFRGPEAAGVAGRVALSLSIHVQMRLSASVTRPGPALARGARPGTRPRPVSRTGSGWRPRPGP